jgi:multidrug efflux pump subunit AcrB
VLAIGIVVDDAIVVVENVERNLARGLSPLEAARTSMDEVSGALVAIVLVLCAVFVPTLFLTGLSGAFYQQFAVTISTATIISLVLSLTLSPALAACCCAAHDRRTGGRSQPASRLRARATLQPRLRPAEHWLWPPHASW